MIKSLKQRAARRPQKQSMRRNEDMITKKQEMFLILTPVKAEERDSLLDRWSVC